jgi:hypothetical protein
MVVGGWWLVKLLVPTLCVGTATATLRVASHVVSSHSQIIMILDAGRHHVRHYAERGDEGHAW